MRFRRSGSEDVSSTILTPSMPTSDVLRGEVIGDDRLRQGPHLHFHSGTATMPVSKKDRRCSLRYSEDSTFGLPGSFWIPAHGLDSSPMREHGDCLLSGSDKSPARLHLCRQASLVENDRPRLQDRLRWPEVVPMTDQSNRLVTGQGLRRADAEDLRRLLHRIADQDTDDSDSRSYASGSEAMCALAVRPGPTARGMLSALEAALTLPEDPHEVIQLGLEEIDGPMALPGLAKRLKSPEEVSHG